MSGFGHDGNQKICMRRREAHKPSMKPMIDSPLPCRLSNFLFRKGISYIHLYKERNLFLFLSPLDGNVLPGAHMVFTIGKRTSASTILCIFLGSLHRGFRFAYDYNNIYFPFPIDTIFYFFIIFSFVFIAQNTR